MFHVLSVCHNVHVAYLKLGQLSDAYKVQGVAMTY